MDSRGDSEALEKTMLEIGDCFRMPLYTCRPTNGSVRLKRLHAWLTKKVPAWTERGRIRPC